MDTAEEPSGYTANFIGDVADYLKCKICMMVLKDPFMLVECGHKFCSSCFNAMKAHTRSPSVRCPVDRGVINNKKVFPDKAIERVILDLYVKCDHNQDGCLWSGELRKLAPHLEEDCICEERKRNSLQLKEHRGRMDEFERSQEASNTEVANVKNETETTKNVLNTLKNMINCLQYQFTECNRQLQETRTEFECFKQEHKQCRLDTSQIHATESPITIDNEVEISSSGTEISVTKVTSTQSDESNGVVESSYMSKLRKRKLDADDDDDVIEVESPENEVPLYKSRLRKKTIYSDEDDQPLINISKSFDGPKEISQTNGSCEEVGVADEQVGTPVTDIKVENRLPGEQSIQVGNVQTKSLHNRMHVLEQLMEYKKTVFKWTLLEYSANKEMGDAVFSPMFYSSVNGHCCRLWIRWSNNETALDLSFQICGVNKEDLKRNPLQRDVTLEMFNMHGENEYKVIPSFSFFNSTGYTFKNFLKTPELENFVNNDSLFIKCTLTLDM